MEKKKISDNELITHIDKYFYDINYERINCLKYTAIAKYLSTVIGTVIPEHTIRRNKEIRQYIQKLKTKSRKTIESIAIVFVPLDVTNFISKNSNTCSLKKALLERDQYYKGICELASKVYEDDVMLNRKISDLTETNKALKAEALEKQEQMNSALLESKNLKVQLKRMRDVLQQSVYPEIANELLREIGLIKGGESIINAKTYPVLDTNDSVIDCIKKNENKYSNNKVIQGLFEKI